MTGSIKVDNSRGRHGVRTYSTDEQGDIRRSASRKGQLQYAHNITSRESKNFRILTLTQNIYVPGSKEVIKGSLNIEGQPINEPLRYIVTYVDSGHYVLGVEIEPDNFMRVMAYIKDQADLSRLDGFVYSPYRFPDFKPFKTLQDEKNKSTLEFILKSNPLKPIFRTSPTQKLSTSSPKLIDDEIQLIQNL